MIEFIAIATDSPNFLLPQEQMAFVLQVPGFRGTFRVPPCPSETNHRLPEPGVA